MRFKGSDFEVRELFACLASGGTVRDFCERSGVSAEVAEQVIKLGGDAFESAAKDFERVQTELTAIRTRQQILFRLGLVCLVAGLILALFALIQGSN